MFLVIPQPLDGPPSNPAVFPVVMLGTAGFLGGILFAVGAERRLAGFVSPELCTVGGAIAITAAQGHAMVCNGNARKIFNVPHPTESTEIPYLNAGRGYYNMVEHFPFFLFNYLLARDSSPCVAGLAGVVFGVGRILYTEGYAAEGPKGRVTGFMVATFASMACLGVGVLDKLFP